MANQKSYCLWQLLPSTIPAFDKLTIKCHLKHFTRQALNMHYRVTYSMSAQNMPGLGGAKDARLSTILFEVEGTYPDPDIQTQFQEWRKQSKDDIQFSSNFSYWRIEPG